MLKIPEAFRAEFEEEAADKTVIGAQTGCILLIVLVPVFGILDWVMYPEIVWDLVIPRLVLTPFEVANLLLLRYLMRRQLARKYSRLLSWSILYPSILLLDLLILRAGGADSGYYAGLNLILLGMMVLIPWGLLEMSLNVVFVWLQYVVVMLAGDPDYGDRKIFIANNYFMLSTVVIGLAWVYISYELRVREFMARKEVAQEKDRSEQLLLNILPAEVAEELMREGQVQARACPSATILFTDFAGFTSISNQIPAAMLVQSLHRLFTGFDEIITRHGLEKLKTIGDAYMCVGGLPTERPGHLVSSVLAALEILDFLSRDQRALGDGSIRWQARVGIHRGPVIAGVIGNRKFAYDVWGDTVNLASRLESASEPGRINVTTSVFEELRTYFMGVDRGYLPVRGKGPVAMTFVEKIRPEFAADELGHFPNARFWKAVRESSLFQERGKEPAPQTQVPGADTLKQRREPMQSELWGQLKGLTESDREHLHRIGHYLEFRLGEYLISQGSQLDALLIIVSGHAGVRLNQDGTNIDVSILGPGDLIGEMSMVTGDPASASVVAIEPGRVVRLSRKDIDEVTSQDVGFAARFYHALASLMAIRLRETNSRLPPLIVEEVAHTKLHHSMITGQAGSDRIPQRLLDAVDEFKEGMRQLDRALLRTPEVTPIHQAQTKELCDAIKFQLTEGLKEVEDPAKRDGVGSYVFRETFPYFMLSRMIDRSFSKPRGYAGDYYTIELIHLLQPQGDRRLGPLIDREYLLSPPCQAVRNRRWLMRDCLQEFYGQRVKPIEKYLITSLACGAGREMFDFMGQASDSETIFSSLLDIDIEALTYSSHLAAEAGLQGQVLFAKENVLHLAMGRGKTRLPPQNVIYSIGLADYLKDEVVTRMINWMYDTLKPGGYAVVGNFSDSNPDHDFMDHILDWRLYHRSVDDMKRIFAASRFGNAVTDVRCEPAGINLMAVCQKP